MYNIENFNTSFNRTLRSLAVTTKTKSYSYRKLHTIYRAYGLEVVITSHYSDSKILISNFSFGIGSNFKDENIHSRSNRTISAWQQLENNRRPIASDSLVNRYSESQLEQFHSVALIASQHLVLTTIESYINELFNDVDEEVTLRNLNSQFNSLSEFSRIQFIKNFASADSQLLTTGGNN
jgi:hypothetical protein